VGLSVAIALLIVVAVAIARPETFWNPDGQDLADSMGGASHVAFALRGPCVNQDSSDWECPVFLDYTPLQYSAEKSGERRPLLVSMKKGSLSRERRSAAWFRMWPEPIEMQNRS
jgi:hypothetical protein